MFIFCALVIAYVYFFYPLFLIVAGSLRRQLNPDMPPDEEMPTVHICIPAYNEEKVIARKIECTLNLDYPREKLTITIVSDKSTDATDSIIQSYLDQGIQYIRNGNQKGKIATISEIGSHSESDILLITDANAIFEPDSLKKLVAQFRDPKVGMVNGNKVLKRTPTMVGEGEGVYWIYETLLKRADSDVFSNAFVTGAMTAIRKELFCPVPDYLEFDHVLPLHVVNQGYRVVFEQDARFYEETAPSSKAEWRVRVRNAIRGFTMVLLMGRYLNIRRHPFYTLHVYSRKVLRWLIGLPAAGMLVANLGLLHHPLFLVLFATQLAFYSAAMLGYFLDLWGIKQGFLALPYYFCLVNSASIVGLFKALRGQRMAVWSTGR
jgi:cellulose synthase/poly-beta-1,6-N-acetylglucosamine synthase-like glycosyltransferase